MAARNSIKLVVFLGVFSVACGHSPLSPSPVLPVVPVYVVIGDSIAMGETYQRYQLPLTIDATVFRKDHAWIRADDPTDLYSDQGSFWPLVIPALPAHSKWVTIAQGGTSLHTHWQPGATYDATTGRSVAWNALQTAMLESSMDHVTAFLCHLGANDIVLDDTLTANSAFADWQALVNALTARWPGAVVYISDLGTVTTGTVTDREDRIAAMRAAIERAWAEIPRVRRGPMLRDLIPDDGVHFRSDASVQIIAQRWRDALK